MTNDIAVSHILRSATVCHGEKTTHGPSLDNIESISVPFLELMTSLIEIGDAESESEFQLASLSSILKLQTLISCKPCCSTLAAILAMGFQEVYMAVPESKGNVTRK